MSKNPFLNAITAISGVQNDINMYIIPVMMLSLFTLSAAVMGYIFCFEPLRMYLDGKKEGAVKLFIRTVGIFGSITLGIILVYFILINS